MTFAQALICSISLMIANFMVEWFHDVPNYDAATLASWHQFVAIMVFYFVWIRPEIKD